MKDHTTIDYRDCDRQIWEEELSEFVPDRILDAHIHFYWASDFPVPPPQGTRNDAGLATLNDWARVLYPGRRMQYLILGMPVVGIDVARHVETVRREIDGVPGIRYNRLVTPSCRTEDIERDLRHPQFIGLKPYRTFSVTGDIAQCRIHEFLPHEQMELADHYGLWVTMHLSRFHGCADEWNLDDLTEYTTKRYPGIKWLLAHCARSFTYWPIRQAVERLRDSAQHLLRHLGGDRRAPLHHSFDQGRPEADLLGLGRCRRRILPRSLRGAGPVLAALRRRRRQPQVSPLRRAALPVGL